MAIRLAWLFCGLLIGLYAGLAVADHLDYNYMLDLIQQQNYFKYYMKWRT